jgi:hypothetical protein
MRWWLAILIVVLAPGAAAQGIEAVLERSQQVRLAKRPAADPRSEAAQRVQVSMARLLALPAAGSEPVELVLVGGGLFAEALLDRPGIAASEELGHLPEGQRLLMLAHELGHVRLSHARALKALYLAHVPGAVVPEATDPVAGKLGAEGHALSHRNELAADAFGFLLVRDLDVGIDDAVGLLTRQGPQRDSITHPGTARRLAQLRELHLRAESSVRLRSASAFD